MSTAYAALLRGINVGGKTQIAMPELQSLVTELGFTDVRTYVRSGNLVFRSDSSDASAVAGRLERRIGEAFDVAPAVLLRTKAELGAIADRNPFLGQEPDPVKLHVVFLETEPPAERRAELDPDRSPPDRFQLDGRELYLHLPNGAGRTKLTLDYIERRLGVRGTGRNWNTVLKLLELMPD
jgi:uncharacterized protein (DUF1697 family)